MRTLARVILRVFARTANSPLTHTLPYHPRLRIELGALERLDTTFSLASNDLTSTIPTELGQMTEITTHFYLRDNSLASAVRA